MSQSPPAEPQRYSLAFMGSALCLLLGIALGFAAALPSRQALTVGQLSKALGLHYWYFKVPPHDPGTPMSLELLDGESVVKVGGSPSGMEVGETLLVTLRQVEANSRRFDVTIQGKSFDFHSSIDAQPLREMTIVEFTRDGESLNEQPLLIGNRKGSISKPSRADKAGDVLLRLVVR